MADNNIFIEILRENWNHMRQQETLRMWIGNVFIAVIVATAAYLGEAISGGELDITTVPLFVPTVILVVSILCLLVTLKANKVFVDTKNSLITMFEDRKIDLGNEINWRTYLGGLESNGIWKILRIRYIYVSMYIIVIVVSFIWLSFILTN